MGQTLAGNFRGSFESEVASVVWGSIGGQWVITAIGVTT
jgi:hypothetical protein